MILVEGLSIRIGNTPILNTVTLSLAPGKVLGLVGESGSGKSTIASAILGLLPASATIDAGAIKLDGMDLLGRTAAQRRGLCGRTIAYIPQEPMSALNPTLKIGRQMDLVLLQHLEMSQLQRRQLARDALKQLGMADPDRILASYPFQLSGGQVQRVLLATALALQARVILADEPTTALDTQVQAEVLKQLRSAATQRQAAVLLISHNIGAVRMIADEIAVICRGDVVETGDAANLLNAPTTQYTKSLLAALPERSKPRTMLPVASPAL
jgi:ABC-type glutathione transport system ATPase component